MAVISNVARLVSGVIRNINLSSSGNALHVDSLQVGSTSPETLTKAILANLIALQNGSDFSVGTNSHTHDGRYYTETELTARTTSSGTKLVGVERKAYANITGYTSEIADTLANYNVQALLDAINTSLATAGATEFADNTFRITDDSDPTKKIAIEAGAIAPGATRYITMPDANVNLADANNAILKDGSRAFTGNQAMGGNKITGLGAPTANGDALRYDQLGAVGGIATLDGGGKVPASQLPSAVMTYEGVWNASTNSPSLADGVGDAGMVYRVGTAGSQNLGSGSISFSVGDYVIYNGTIWEKSDTTDAVASVNGATGIVTVNAINQLTGDVTAGPASGSASAVATIANSAVTTAKIANAAVDADKIATSVAGAGLSGGGGSALSVNVDGTTVEIDTDTLRLKDLGVSTAKIADDAVTKAKINSDVAGTGLAQAADGSLQARGVYLPLTNGSGASIDAGSVVYLNGGADSFSASDADAESTCKATIGILLATTANGAEGLVQVAGRATVVVESGSLTPGERVYVSPTAGKVTHAFGSQVVFLMGIAVSTTEIILQPQLVAVVD